MGYLDSAGLNRFWQNLKTLLNGKQDAVTGKGLSTNDYTDDEKDNLTSAVEASNELNDLMAGFHGSINIDVNRTQIANIPEGTPTNSLVNIQLFGKTTRRAADNTLNSPEVSKIYITPDANMIVKEQRTVASGDGNVTYVSNADGSVVLNGTAAETWTPMYDANIQLDSNTSYLYVGNPAGGNSTDTFKSQFTSVASNNSSGSTVTYNMEPTDRTFTTPDTNGTFAWRPVIYSGYTAENLTYRPFLVPYLNVSSVNLTARTLRGIPVDAAVANYIDEHGQGWLCDTINLKEGTYTQRVQTYTFTDTEPVQTNSVAYLGPTPTEEGSVVKIITAYGSSISPQ